MSGFLSGRAPSGTAAIATTVTITDNESTNESNAIIFTAGGDIDGGNLGLESDGTLTYNPSTGKITATGFVGTLTGDVTGNTSGTAATVTTPAQPNITSLGTLTALTVDDVAIDGKVITMTGSSSDTAIFTASTNGALSIVTTDAAAAAANITITADGTAELAGTTVTLNSSGGVTIDADNGTITFSDAGSSLGTITSSGYTGDVVGNVSGTAATVTTAAQPNITSLGTLTTLTVDNVIINGANIGHTSDPDLMTVADGVLTIAGELDAATLDISGNADIDGTMEADAYTVDGTALNEYISDTVGAMVSSNTETGITVTYQDGDNTLDFVIGTLNQDTSGTAAKVTVTDSTTNLNFPVVFHNESNALLDDTGALRYNPSTGTLLVPNLTVAGTTTQVDTVTMQAANAVIFEGATTDDFETTLSIVDPTADRTQYLINQGGYIPVLAAVTTTAISSTPAELNILDGATVVVGEINALDLGSTAVGTAIASKAVILDSNKDYTGLRNLTITGELDAATLDISGDVDVDGTLEADAITINGTAIGSIYGVVAGSSSIVTVGALDSGSITSGFTSIDVGAGAITTTGIITGGTVEATTDTAADDNAAMGYTSVEGLILTGQGSTSDVTIKNDADATVISIPTGTTNVTIAGDLTITGDDLTMGTNTSGAALIADGTNFNPVVML